MITLKELLNGNKYEDQTEEVKKNLTILLKRINIVRKKWNKAMYVSSGLRSLETHLKIYEKKGITDQSKIPMKSKHLVGAAVDIADPKKELIKWLTDNPEVLEEANLYCELDTDGWCHFQCLPFGSYKTGGTRWFKA